MFANESNGARRRQHSIAQTTHNMLRQCPYRGQSRQEEQRRESRDLMDSDELQITLVAPRVMMDNQQARQRSIWRRESEDTGK